MRIYIALRARKAVQILFPRYHFYLISDFYMLLILQSAPCRLAPNEALPQTPLGALPLDPTSPLAPGLSVRFISCFARCFIFTLCLQFTLVCYAHSSFLTPHLNSAPIKNFPLIIPPKSAILLISKIARNHNPKEVNFYELYSFQKLLPVL